MKKIKILLVGQPNVGKSSLLNALVGSKVVASNYPGTTVEILKAEKTVGETIIIFVDTPGIYSIADRSKEEKITAKALFEGKFDGVVIVADVCSLERSLYLALQILEAEIPAVIALNFVEEAGKKGISVDADKLSHLLRIPVIPINPVKRKGMDILLDSLTNIGQEDFYKIVYDDHIEQAIHEISYDLKQTDLPKRFISVRILEKDEDFYKYVSYEDTAKKTQKILSPHPKVEEDISVTRYGIAAFIAEKATTIIHRDKSASIQKKMDDILLHKIYGPLATFLILLTIFGLLLFLGNYTQDILMNLTEKLLLPLTFSNTSIFKIVLVQGLTGVMAGISIALPYVFLFYVILGFLEDVGILPRFIVNTERFFKLLGLPGKAFIPLSLGLGCSVSAERATRILTSDKEKMFTLSLFAFVPCSSRIAVIMGIVGFFGGQMMAVSVLFSLFIAALIWSFALKKVLRIKKEPLLIELPPYRVPLLKNIMIKSWIRMKDFIYLVIPLLALGGIIYALFDTMNLTEKIANPFSPITGWLGLPKETIIPLLFGFFQKDLTATMLLSALGQDISSILKPMQIFTFGLASSIGIPCIIAFGVLIKEIGIKKSALIFIATMAYGILFSGVVFRMIRFIF
ncbi:ferrous iron transport protein B [candidate division WOR-3 bacterium]|nr:ferrous iron transport protein B [candidate division WOR-3 bacterium]